MARQTRQTQQPTEQPKADKAEKFVKLASTRTNKVLEAMDVLGNCFNRNNYTYTDEQVEKIFTALETKVDEIRSLTNPEAPKAVKGFSL